MKMFKCPTNYLKAKENSLICLCQKYQKHIQFVLERKSKEKFASTFKLWKGDLNEFILLLRKEVYPYEYMYGWKNVVDIWYAWKKWSVLFKN